jgi:hypothetical protein
MPTLPRSIAIAITILPHRLAGGPAKAAAAWTTASTGGIVVVKGSSSHPPRDPPRPGGRAAAVDDARIGRPRTLAMSRDDDDEDYNRRLWSAALEGMIDVPGASGLSSPEGVMYLAPVSVLPPREGAAAAGEWPASFADGCGVFSLTAHNPMGTTAPPDANDRADEALGRDVLALARGDGASGPGPGSAARVPRPRAWWRSFGFHEGEGWREDGYTLAFEPGDRDAGRAAVLGLAREYQQAAVYEYARVSSGLVTREVVYVDPPKNEHGEVALGGGGGVSRDVMVIVGAPPRSALSGRYRRAGAAVPDAGV